MTSSQNPNDPQQLAFEALELAHEADPRTHPIGVFLSADHPRGIGMFHWFEGEADLVQALTRIVPLAVADADADPTELQELIDRLVQAAAEFAPTERLGAPCIAMLQVHLRGKTCIEWTGTFDSLCSSADAWPSELRERFREWSGDPCSSQLDERPHQKVHERANERVDETVDETPCDSHAPADATDRDFDGGTLHPTQPIVRQELDRFVEFVHGYGF